MPQNYKTKTFLQAKRTETNKINVDELDTVKFRNKPWGLYFSKALFKELIFGGAYIRRGLSTEGNLCFKIDLASLIVGGPFTNSISCDF